MLSTLNKLWIEYDRIARKWGVYKVETIGDAFLGISGCPERATDHAVRAVHFAIDIMKMVGDFRTTTGEAIQIRVGLNSGPVTAGVLGDMNPHWCIVGDTVNTASRMERFASIFEEFQGLMRVVPPNRCRFISLKRRMN